MGEKPRKYKLLLISLALCALLSPLAGCRNEDTKPPAFWVVAGTNRGESFYRNSLGGYNLQGERVIKKNLPPFYISSLFQDRLGRLWLGQGWNDTESSNLLLLLENGQLSKEIPVGEQPEAGIVEFGDSIIAGCTEAGMGFSLWEVSNSLESQEVIRVNPEEQAFLFLTTIASTPDYLVAAAIHDGPGEGDTSHASIYWFHKDFSLAGKMYLGPDTAIWSMMPKEDGTVLLLNNSAFVQGQADILIFDPARGEITDAFQGSGYPFRGVAHQGKVYILDRIWSSTRINAKRSITILDNGTATTIPLPDGLGAEDIAVAEGMVYLAVWQRGAGSGDGIYTLDPATGELQQIIEHQDASAILIPGQ